MDEVDYRGHSSAHYYRYQRGSLNGLDREQKVIHLAPIEDEDGVEVLPARQLTYDYLVLSLGSISNDFGTKESQSTATLLTLPSRPKPSSGI